MYKWVADAWQVSKRLEEPEPDIFLFKRDISLKKKKKEKHPLLKL